MWLDLLFAWPDQLPALALFESCSLESIAVQLRVQQHLDAEHRMLAAFSRASAVDAPALVFLQVYLAFARDDLTRADELIRKIQLLGASFPAEWKLFLSLQLALKRSDLQALPLPSDSISW